MKIELSDYYKGKGFKSAYLVVNKEPRRIVILVRNDGSKTSVSYAKYLYTSHYKIDIKEGYEIDHINNDRMDDRLENYQVLSKSINASKGHREERRVEMTCPICGKKFQFLKRNLSTHPNPCCSRRCGGIKSREKFKKKKLNKEIAFERYQRKNVMFCIA